MVHEGLEIELLLRAAESSPDTMALKLGDRGLSYGQLQHRVAWHAARLRDAGARRAEVVALLMDNSLEFVIGYFAIQWLGCTAMPLNPKDGPQRLQHCLARTGARLVLVSPQTDTSRPPLAELAERGGVVYLPVQVDPAGDNVVQQAAEALPPALGAEAAELALVMFTTGTTGAPKGVKLRHENTLAAMRGIRRVMQVPEGTVEVVPTPLYHSFALARLRVVFACRGTLVLAKGFVFPTNLLSLIERSQAQGFASVPAGWEILISAGHERFAQAFRQVRYAEIGSSAMSAALRQSLVELLPGTRLYYHYGLTEASRSAFVELHQTAGEPASLGAPLPGVQISIRDPRGQTPNIGSEGEICVQGPTVFAGYLGDDEATQAAFFGPWLRTGDLGRIDDSGRLQLSGRLKEMINLGGSKLSPAEVEEALNACPGIRESAVIGLAEGGRSTEIIHAFLVRHPDAGCSLEQVQRFVASRLEPLHRPAHYHFVAELPKTESGKLQRLSLRALLDPVQ